MKSFLIIFPLLVFSWLSNAQVNSKSYALTLNTLLDHSVREISVEEFARSESQYILLDAREKTEYEVSKIQGARFVGYDDFDIKLIQDIDRNANIVVYCSVGYRSEKVAERMEAAGFKHVSNLYGGIFEWKNQGFEVVGPKGQKTNKVHAFDRIWGIWLEKGEKVY